MLYMKLARRSMLSALAFCAFLARCYGCRSWMSTKALGCWTGQAGVGFFTGGSASLEGWLLGITGSALVGLRDEGGSVGHGGFLPARLPGHQCVNPLARRIMYVCSRLLNLAAAADRGKDSHFYHRSFHCPA